MKFVNKKNNKEIDIDVTYYIYLIQLLPIICSYCGINIKTPIKFFVITNNGKVINYSNNKPIKDLLEESKEYKYIQFTY